MWQSLSLKSNAIYAHLRKATAVLQAMSALATRVAAAAIAYLFQIYLAQNLGIENYGVFVTFWTWQVILTHISVMGFDESIVRFLPRYVARAQISMSYSFVKNGLKFILLTSLFCSSLMGLVLYFGHDLFADQMRGSAVVLAIGLPVLALELYVEGVARASGKYLLGIIPGYVLRPIFVMATLFVLHQSGVALSAEIALAAVIGVTLFLVVIQGLIVWRGVQKQRFIGSAERHKKVKRLWMLAAFPLVLITGVEELLYWSDIVILGFMVPSADVSIYFAALRVMAITSFIHYAFMFVFAREFSIAKAGGDKKELQKQIDMASTWTFWLTIPAVLIILACGPFLLSFFGEVFVSGQIIMLAIGLGIIGKSIIGPAVNLLIVMGHEKQNVLIAGIALALNIGLTMLLIPIIGILGAAIGTATAQILRSIVLAIYCHKKLELNVISQFDPRSLFRIR